MIGAMTPVVALPARGGVFADARGGDRALRVSWHHEAGLVVLSVWRGDTCTASFRLRQSDVLTLVQAMDARQIEAYQPVQQARQAG